LQRQHFNRRGFSRAIFTEQSENFAAINDKAHAVDRPRCAEYPYNSPQFYHICQPPEKNFHCKQNRYGVQYKQQLS